MKIVAHVIPYSCIVGGGIALLDETGHQIGQLSLRGYAGGHLDDPDGPSDEDLDKAKVAYIAMCERLADAINLGQAEGQVTHTKKGSTYDVVASEALFQVSDRQDLFGIPMGRIVQDGDPVTVYRNEHGTFVRFPDEMVSPRFEKVQP